MPDQNLSKDLGGVKELNAVEIDVPSEAKLPRRRRYARSQSAFASLTPVRIEMLRFLAELRFLSLPQLAKLCCPSDRKDLSEKSARRQMRVLFDAGLVDVLPVSRAALTQLESPNDASLLYGSAPNIYTLTAAGLDALSQAELCDKVQRRRAKPTYGPKNSLFLAHELAVRDVRVWLEEVARSGGYSLEVWHDGETATIDLARTQAPLWVRPDAWFVLRMPKAVLVGLVEVDRGTERGSRSWQEKLTAYEALFESGCLPAVTGYVNARVLVVTPSDRRRDLLAGVIGEFGGVSASKFWLCQQSALATANLLLPHWRQQHDQPLRPLYAPP